MLWTIYCTSKPNIGELRNQHVPAHRKYLDANEPHLFFAGAIPSDDESDLRGAMFILNVKSRAEAQAFIDAEPLNRAGVFDTVTIFRLRKGRFNPNLVDLA